MIILGFKRDSLIGLPILNIYQEYLHVDTIIPVPCHGAKYCHWCKEKAKQDPRHRQPQAKEFINKLHLISVVISTAGVLTTIDKHWKRPSGGDWCYMVIRVLNTQKCITFIEGQVRKPYNLVGSKYNYLPPVCASAHGTRIDDNKTTLYNNPCWLCSELPAVLFVWQEQPSCIDGRHPCQLRPQRLFEILNKNIQQINGNIHDTLRLDWLREYNDTLSVHLQHNKLSS